MESMSLLNMLAEIASEKLQTDPTVRMISKSEETKCDTKSVSSEVECHHNQGKPMTLQQVSNSRENNILRLFTVSQANELKRKFYFTCRLLPQHCEETFQSFGSEDKARSLMKKHLKEHLNTLLNEYKEVESREKYILRTVSTAKLSNGDSKSNTRKPKRAKTDIKAKGSYEKENFKLLSRKLETSSSSNNNGSSTSFVSNTNTEEEQMSSLVPQNITPITNNSKYYEAQIVASKHSTAMINDYSSTNFAGNNAFGAQIVNNNEHGEVSELQVHDYRYEHEETSNVTYGSTYEGNVLHNNKFNVYMNSSNENIGQANAIENNGIIYITPTTNQYLNSSSSQTYNSSIYDSDTKIVSKELLKRNVEIIPNIPVCQVSPKKMKTEIIDIKIGDSVKLEVLSSSNQHLTENSFVSHDRVYIENESNATISSQDLTGNYKEVKVEQDLMDIWRDFTGGSIVFANGEHEERSATATESTSITLESKKAVNINSEEKQEPMDATETKEKVRLKGRGKFIGQSKNEKQMALSLIEKIKSYPPVQLESLECTICNPPRTFTAAATLLSHYKSHAGIRPYVCVYCEAVFTRQHSLKYHYLIHFNKTRFTCDECGRKFRHPSHFKEHLRRHTGESPYECTDCLMRFKTRNTYKRHLRTRHGKKLTTQGSVNSVTEEESLTNVHKKNEKQKEEINTISEEKIILQNRFDDAGNSNSSSNPTLVDSPNDVKWASVVSIDANDRDKSPELNVQPISEERFSADGNVQIKSTYHEMLPVEVSDFCNDAVTHSYAFKNTEVKYDHMYTGEEASLPTTSAAALNVCERGQPVSNLFKNDSEIIYVVNKAISYNEIPQNSVSLENINYDSAECTQDLYSSADTGNAGYEIGSSLNRLTESNSLGSTGNPLPIQYQIENENTGPETSYNNISNSANFTSKSNQCDDMKHLATGSILGALLTSGNSRGMSSANPIRTFKSNSPDRCSKSSSDKWDSLMREVVSLSTMAKGKMPPCDREEVSASQQVTTVQTGNVIKPMKELSNNFRFDRFGSKDVNEVYVLKYSNGTTGTRVAKVFKTKSPLNTKEGVVERRKENANMMGRKPILITSTLGPCDEKQTQSSS